MGHLLKIYIQDGKSKMQHYFLRHSTGKFSGENGTSYSSSSNLFLVNGNDLCIAKTIAPELSLLVLIELNKTKTFVKHSLSGKTLKL